MLHLINTPVNNAPRAPSSRNCARSTGSGCARRAGRPTGAPRGTVALFGGRGGIHREIFRDDRRSAATAASASPRSTGAARAARSGSWEPRKDHIDDFSLYERDLNAFVTEMLAPLLPEALVRARPFHGRGDPADDRPRRALPVRAPGADLADDRHRRPAGRPRFARFCIEALDALGLGGVFAPGGRAKPIGLGAVRRQSADLRSGALRAHARAPCAPTPRSASAGRPIGWVHAAIPADAPVRGSRLTRARSSRRRLSSPRAPTA